MRKRLREARKAAGMTQKQLAERLGISERQYSRIEHGSSLGAIDLWDELEDFTGVNQRQLRVISARNPDIIASR